VDWSAAKADLELGAECENDARQLMDNVHCYENAPFRRKLGGPQGNTEMRYVEQDS
jgi:hypothetical protein